MPDTSTCTADLTVSLPRAAALALFTPQGERAWAHGWNPAFPVPDRVEGPGTVFVTEAATHTTTWIMVDQDDDGVRYARVTSGRTAGTVTVSVLDTGLESTRLRVSYDLAVLNQDGADWLGGFAGNFTDYIAHWETMIAEATARNRSSEC